MARNFEPERDGLTPVPPNSTDEKGQDTAGGLQMGSWGPNSQSKDFCRGYQHFYGTTDGTTPPPSAAERAARLRGRRAPPQFQPRRRRAVGDAGRGQPADPESR